MEGGMERGWEGPGKGWKWTGSEGREVDRRTPRTEHDSKMTPKMTPGAEKTPK